MTLLRRLCIWLGWVSQPKDRMTAWTEFHGGPKDGDREQLAPGVSVLSVVRYVPVVLSPWGEPEATDLCRIVRTGTYHRTAQGMVWSPEEGQ